MSGTVRLRLQIWARRVKAIAHIIFNTAQFISALIAILATAAGAAIIAWISDHSDWVAVLCAFALGILVTLSIVIYSFLRTSPTRWMLRGYRWVTAEYLYRFHDNDLVHHSQTISIELEALRPGIDHFENRYMWTGSGEEREPQVQSEGHSYMGALHRRGGWKFYYIHLGHELAVGERATVRIFQDLHDHERKFEPYLAKVVLEPLDHLVLHVVFPEDRLPIQVFYIEGSTPIPTNAILRKTPGKFDPASREIRWEVPSPVLGHRYEVRWRWKDGGTISSND